MACLPYASCCVASYAYCLCVASCCVSLRRCVVLRRRMLRIVFRFASAFRFALRCVLRCVAYCVEGVSRIALRFVEALRVACCVSFCIALRWLRCVVFRVSCFVQGEVFRCDVAMFRFVVVYCVSS